MIGFLDMDGVLADFVGGMVKAHGLPCPYKEMGWREFHFERAWDMPVERFWKVADWDFWAGLEKTPEADAIVAACERVFGDELVVFSSPSANRGCVDGKLNWLRGWFPQFAEPGRHLFGARKELASGPGKVLIDDHEGNVLKWIARGGTGVLVPRAWNELRGMEYRCGEWVESEIAGLATKSLNHR